MYNQLQQFIALFSLIIFISFNHVNSQNYSHNYIRIRKLDVVDRYYTEMKCIYKNNKCTCEAYCFKPNNTTGYCNAHECTQWDSVLKVCVNKNEDWTTAIILQSIPAVSQLGAGYGYIGRWDFFAGIWAPLGLICIVGCLFICIGGEEGSDTAMGFTSIIACLWGVSQLVLYIYGIWAFATQNIKDGDGCTLYKDGTIISNTSTF